MNNSDKDPFITPVGYLFYNRPECIKITFPLIQKLRPQKLYLLSDGPKDSKDAKLCQQSRIIIDQHLNWDCKINKIYSETNLGLAQRTVSAIDQIFKAEDRLIFLEDDNLVDPSFFNFCHQTLQHYEMDERIFHIGGCNFYEKAVPFHTKEDYLLSAKPAAWGFATWKRAWMHMDLTMKKWDKEDKLSFLSKWCISQKHIKGIKEVFDQHCMNPDPWAWSYAWTYACWANDALSIIPKVNLVSNIGFGPDATNTTMRANHWRGIPSSRGSLPNKIKHPESITRSLSYDKNSYYMERGSPIRRFKQFVKSFLKN